MSCSALVTRHPQTAPCPARPGRMNTKPVAVPRGCLCSALAPQSSVSEPWLSWKHSRGSVGSSMCPNPQHPLALLSRKVFAVERVGTSQHICTPVLWPLSPRLPPGLAGRTQGKLALTTQSHGFLRATLSLTFIRLSVATKQEAKPQLSHD